MSEHCCGSEPASQDGPSVRPRSHKENSFELDIAGMHCASCAANIEKHLRKIGLEDALVDFSAGKATFSAREPGILERVEKEVEKLGYRVTRETGKGNGKILWTLRNKFIFSLVLTLPLLLHMLPGYHLLHQGSVQLALCTPVFILGLLHFGRSALGSLKAGYSNMDVLITVSITAAYVYSLLGTLLGLGPDYLFYETSATIVTIVLFGNLLEERAVKKTTSAIEELSRIQPATAKRLTIAGQQELIEEVPVNELRKGDVLVVNTGDKVPVDGKVVWGEGSIDQSMLTGESVPVEVTADGKVIGGTSVVSGSIRMEALALGEDSVLANMIKLVRQAQTSKPKLQRIGDRVSAYFTPLVALLALSALLLSYFVFNVAFTDSLLRAIAVLVIACPCALGLATPTAVMVGIGQAARHGIVIKGGETLEQLAGVSTMIFDKTGTLTTGRFVIMQLKTADQISERGVKAILHGLERHSSHPIAKSIVRELAVIPPLPLNRIEENRGLSISGYDAEGNFYQAGSEALVSALPHESGYSIYLLCNKKLVAWLEISDELKSGAAEATRQLRELGIEPVLLSGDRQKKCEELAARLGITRVFSEKLPDEKLKIIETMEQQSRSAFVGDGINDAAALARAHVGISLSSATDAAIDSAKVVLLNENLQRIVAVVKVARVTVTTIKQNLFWAFLYNVAAIPMAATGYLNPMVAAVAMAFSDVVVVANSLRLKAKIR